MKSIFLLFMTLLLPLHAQSIKAGYDVSFGIIGEIGKADITYTHDRDSYVIYVHAWTTGTASILTQNREEDYISQGHIIDGVLRPDVFVKFRKSDSYAKSSVYLFDYDEQKISLYTAKVNNVQSTKYDVNTMKNVKVCSEEFSHSSEPFHFFTDNDLLSLFFNTQKIFPLLKDGDSKTLAAIGSKSPNCEIDIEVPTKELTQEIKAVMTDSNGTLLTIILNQDIFQSERGELHVIFDDDGFAKDVLLKDVILFGDIRGKRIYQELSVN